MGKGSMKLLFAGVGLADEVPRLLRWAARLLGLTAITAFG
jgi:hypothetical protein